MTPNSTSCSLQLAIYLRLASCEAAGRLTEAACLRCFNVDLTDIALSLAVSEIVGQRA
ncbi:hypothetical protein [Candidatus Williamhamiltonella defendens]|uniref:hypothetical protein n=1 Tax=Candidatus Williamhamiltonella defendens TaxID=138072 RepID=UPI001C9D85D3|nr:hypothetical protein [Candidatus Hamiltonella defensa]